MSPFTKKEIEEMKDMFINRTTESIDHLEVQIRNLEQDYSDSISLIELYRAIHSLKGNSATVGLVTLEKFFHNYESFISAIQDKKVSINKEIIDIFYDSLDLIEDTVSKLRTDEPPKEKFKLFNQKFEKIRAGNLDGEEAQKTLRIRELLKQHGLKEFKFDDINFNDSKSKVYEIKIKLEEGIKLKLARLLVVLKKIEKIGVIAQTYPKFDKIIAGELKRDVKILFQSEMNPEEIKKKILSAGEIESVIIEHLSQDEAQNIVEDEQIQRSMEKIEKSFTDFSQIHTVKVNLQDLDKLVEYFGELLIRSNQLEKLLQIYNRTDINEILFQMENYIFNLQDTVLQMQLVPISQVFRAFPRMVRNLTNKQNKSIKLNVTHHDVKVDRKILNEIGNIVNHLIRNAIYHGIETIDEREDLNKEPESKIDVETYIANKVLNIEISDDGRGIDPKIIGEKAMKKGLYSPDQLKSMSVENIINIIFQPNFSTAQQVNKVSGRGLGLNIVKKTIERLGGSISLETHVNIGTTFKVQLPISRTLIRALLVKVGNEVFSIPLDDIEYLFSITREDLLLIENQYYAKHYEKDERIPLYDLGKQFQISNDILAQKDIQFFNVVHINTGNQNFGIIVDEFLEETEIVIKTIDDYSGKVKGISGAAILDDGRVSLILDPFTFNA